MLQWSEQFSTGVGHLDHQHQALIDNINQLETLLVTPNPSREEYQFMLRLLDFLEFYAKNHFAAEEKCMESFRCPIHKENKMAHEKFQGFFTEFQKQCRASGLRKEFIVKLHATVSEWIVDHILQIDLQLKPCIKGNATPV
jgi:hemerythrin